MIIYLSTLFPSYGRRKKALVPLARIRMDELCEIWVRYESWDNGSIKKKTKVASFEFCPG